MVASSAVAVHGIFQHRSDRATMQAAWSTALAAGLLEAGLGDVSLSLECAFYGDLYAGVGAKSADAGPVRLSMLTPFEQELLRELAADPRGPDDEEPAKAWGLRHLQAVLARAQERRVFDGVAADILTFVRQVGLYFSEPDLRAAVHAEMSRAMETRPRVVLAHSLGSVVAYEWLRDRPLEDLPVLVTMGSPLGLRAIRARVGAEGRLPFPQGARAWSNVADENDLVALVKHLADVVDGPVTDRLCRHAVLRSHAAVAYLADPTTAALVGACLE